MSNIEVILEEKVENLGTLGDIVTVRSGFARNFLYPKGKAKPATPENKANFEARRKELEKIAEEALQAAKKRAEALSKLEITISRKAGEEGKLFGSVGTRDIADAISDTGIEVSKKEICLPNGLIRQVGDYDIQLKLHTDVSRSIKISVTPAK